MDRRTFLKLLGVGATGLAIRPASTVVEAYALPPPPLPPAVLTERDPFWVRWMVEFEREMLEVTQFDEHAREFMPGWRVAKFHGMTYYQLDFESMTKGYGVVDIDQPDGKARLIIRPDNMSANAPLDSLIEWEVSGEILAGRMMMGSQMRQFGSKYLLTQGIPVLQLEGQHGSRKT